jgi:hypothetical protein
MGSKPQDQAKAWRIAEIRRDISNLNLSLYEEVQLLDRTLRAEGLFVESDDESDFAGPSGYRVDSSPSSEGSLRDFVPDSEDDSDSDSSVKSRRFDTTHLFVEDVPGKSFNTLSYTESEMIQMIPAKPEFDRLKVRLGIAVVTYRYDPALSNRAYKRQFLRLHGSPRGLKYLKKYKKVVTGNEIIPMIGKRGNFRGRRRGAVRVYKNVKLPERIVEVLEPRVSRHRDLAPKRENKPSLRRVGKARVDESTFEGYLDYLGGPVIRIPPRPWHKKYWYFFRKRGQWTFSEHHPYGDESVYTHAL